MLVALSIVSYISLSPVPTHPTVGENSDGIMNINVTVAQEADGRHTFKVLEPRVS